MADPLAFDASKVLKFEMPAIKSRKFLLDCDKKNPYVSFKESNFYQEKHHLDYYKGSEKRLKELKYEIRNFDSHHRHKYDLSPNKEIRYEQV